MNRDNVSRLIDQRLAQFEAATMEKVIWEIKHHCKQNFAKCAPIPEEKQKPKKHISTVLNDILAILPSEPVIAGSVYSSESLHTPNGLALKLYAEGKYESFGAAYKRVANSLADLENRDDQVRRVPIILDKIIKVPGVSRQRNKGLSWGYWKTEGAKE